MDPGQGSGALIGSLVSVAVLPDGVAMVDDSRFENPCFGTAARISVTSPIEFPAGIETSGIPPGMPRASSENR